MSRPSGWIILPDAQKFLDGLSTSSPADYDRLVRSMETFRQSGWDCRTKMAKRLVLYGPLNVVPLYEIKRHQDRVLFCRRGDDAVALTGVTKKADWDLRSDRVLHQAVRLAKELQ